MVMIIIIIFEEGKMMGPGSSLWRVLVNEKQRLILKGSIETIERPRRNKSYRTARNGGCHIYIHLVVIKCYV